MAVCADERALSVTHAPTAKSIGGEKMEESNILFSIGPLEVTSTVMTMWVMIAVLALISWLATRKMKDVPGPLQSAAEIAVGSLQNYFEGNLGKKAARKYFPVFATFFIFIIVSNYSGLLPGAGHLPGFAVPTACLSVTAALGIIAFFTTHTIGIREKGFKKYMLSFLKPVALMLPLTLLEQFVRPLSLALRLYGNLYGEETVGTQLYNIFPILVPLIIQVLGLLFCMIQALVFTMLLSIYVGEAIEEE